jgi:hypothetical protein
MSASNDLSGSTVGYHSSIFSKLPLLRRPCLTNFDAEGNHVNFDWLHGHRYGILSKVPYYVICLLLTYILKNRMAASRTTLHTAMVYSPNSPLYPVGLLLTYVLKPTTPAARTAANFSSVYSPNSPSTQSVSY